jgi:hypothetical protein
VKIAADDLAQLSKLLDEALELSADARESWLARLPVWAGRLSLSEGIAAMYQGRHSEADVHLRAYIASLSYEIEARTSQSDNGHLDAAANLMMAGNLDQAKALLLAAPTPRADSDFRIISSTGPSRDVQSAMAHIKLIEGDPEGALAAMPSAEHDRLEQFFPFSNQPVVRAEIMCALKERRKEGLALMLKHIDEYSRRDLYAYDADVARARAVAGLCALAMGLRPLARELADKARTALAMQPDISPWHRAQSIQLEALLKQPVPRPRKVSSIQP